MQSLDIQVGIPGPPGGFCRPSGKVKSSRTYYAGDGKRQPRRPPARASAMSGNFCHLPGKPITMDRPN